MVGLTAVVAVTAACGGGDAAPATDPTSTAADAASAATAPTATAPLPSATSTATPTATPEATAATADSEPRGFPIEPQTTLGRVVGPPGGRIIAWDGGPSALEYSRDSQPSLDAEAANASGWDCRVHVAYEGQPAVDWYVPEGTPVRATMDGTAHLLVVSAANPFDVYGVAREPYLGNPRREDAPISPFPGPGGGKGIFVRLESVDFVTDYGHLDLRTIEAVPQGAFLEGYDPGTDLAAVFGSLRDSTTFTEIARWPAKRGDVIGVSGDTGYSEAPHLHYTIRRTDSSQLLCPTMEGGFAGGGWLFVD